MLNTIKIISTKQILLNNIPYYKIIDTINYNSFITYKNNNYSQYINSQYMDNLYIDVNGKLVCYLEVDDLPTHPHYLVTICGVGTLHDNINSEIAFIYD